MVRACAGSFQYGVLDAAGAGAAGFGAATVDGLRLRRFLIDEVLFGWCRRLMHAGLCGGWEHFRAAVFCGAFVVLGVELHFVGDALGAGFVGCDVGGRGADVDALSGEARRGDVMHHDDVCRRLFVVDHDGGRGLDDAAQRGQQAWSAFAGHACGGGEQVAGDGGEAGRRLAAVQAGAGLEAVERRVERGEHAAAVGFGHGVVELVQNGAGK